MNISENKKCEFNLIFNGTQKEMKEFIIKCDKYIDVPIAKWGDFTIVYNKLDGIFQDYHGGWADPSINEWNDITPYFIEEVIPFQDTLNDIGDILNAMGASIEFIDKVYELLNACDLDTYEETIDDLDESEILAINEMRNKYVFKIDLNQYKAYMNKEYDKENENLLNFDPTEINKYNI